LRKICLNGGSNCTRFRPKHQRKQSPNRANWGRLGQCRCLLLYRIIYIDVSS
jgi:hypothetical protein